MPIPGTCERHVEVRTVLMALERNSGKEGQRLDLACLSNSGEPSVLTEDFVARICRILGVDRPLQYSENARLPAVRFRIPPEFSVEESRDALADALRAVEDAGYMMYTWPPTP